MKSISLGVLGALALLGASSPIAHSQEMPPRMVGKLKVDEMTMAPLQYIVSAHLKAPPKRIFAHISDNQTWVKWSGGTAKDVMSEGDMRTFMLAEGGSLKERTMADEMGGLFTWSMESGNSYGLQDHLGVIHLQPQERPIGKSTVLSWHMFFSHEQEEMMNDNLSKRTMAIVEMMIEEFGGEFYGGTYGISEGHVIAERVVDTSIEKVWDVLANRLGDVSEWSSVVSHAMITKPADGGMVGTMRSCEVPGQPGFAEKVIQYDENEKIFAYQVVEGLPPFVTYGANTWKLTPMKGGKTQIKSHITMDIAEGTPSFAVGSAKSGFFQLIGLGIEELAHYSKTGNPHPRAAQASGQ